MIYQRKNYKQEMYHEFMNVVDRTISVRLAGHLTDDELQSYLEAVEPRARQSFDCMFQKDATFSEFDGGVRRAAWNTGIYLYDIFNDIIDYPESFGVKQPEWLSRG